MSQRVFFLISILLVFIGVLGLSGFFKSKTPSAVIAPNVIYKVAQLNSDIRKGEILERPDIRYIKLTEEDALKNGISNNIEINHISGMVAKRNINASEFIRSNDFLMPGDPGYLDAVTGEGMTPYPLNILRSDYIGLGISVGDFVDIIILTSDEQNIGETSNSKYISSFRSLAVSPLIKNVKVLAIDENDDDFLPLTIELSRQQIAKMVIARRIGIIEVIKSSFKVQSHNMDINANTHDVLPNFKSVVEIRGQTRALN
ncbi:pilus assembly protein CpaB [Enterovibrio sp. Hal110]